MSRQPFMETNKIQEKVVGEHRLDTLPKWAQRYIDNLERRVRRVEQTIPWTEPGMDWFTLLKDSEPEILFLCDKNGTHPIASIGKGDRVFVGRAKKID